MSWLKTATELILEGLFTYCNFLEQHWMLIAFVFANVIMGLLIAILVVVCEIRNEDACNPDHGDLHDVPFVTVEQESTISENE